MELTVLLRLQIVGVLISINIYVFIREIEHTYNTMIIKKIGLIMILDGVAGAVAANTVIKTAIGVSGLTAIITWFVWAILIYVIGVKLFPDKDTKIPFKKVLTAVGFAHAPGLIRFFAVTPELMIPIIFLTQFWIFAGLIISTKQILNLKSNIILDYPIVK